MCHFKGKKTCFQAALIFLSWFVFIFYCLCTLALPAALLRAALSEIMWRKLKCLGSWWKLTNILKCFEQVTFADLHSAGVFITVKRWKGADCFLFAGFSFWAVNILTDYASTSQVGLLSLTSVKNDINRTEEEKHLPELLWTAGAQTAVLYHAEFVAFAEPWTNNSVQV